MASGKPDPNKILHIPFDCKFSGYEDRINHLVVEAKRPHDECLDGLFGECSARKLRSEEALNGYRYDKTNALAGGPNNAIKLLKKRSYGNPTFARMRRRRLFTLGYYKLSQNYVHLLQVDASPVRRKREVDGGATGSPAAHK